MPATATPSGFPPDSFAHVVTNDLRVRSEPGVGENSMKLEPLLQDGTAVFVVEGPVTASGYDWYLVHPLQPPSDTELYLPPPGWVAAADKDGEEWLEALPVDCPSSPVERLPIVESEFGTLAWPPHALLRLACFGGAPWMGRAALGVQFCSGGEPAYIFVPAMFNYCDSSGRMMFLTEVDDRSWAYGRLDVHFDPSIEPPGGAERAPEEWPLVNVTGQFDHPAAQTCRAEPIMSPPLEPPNVVLQCRAEFVVTSLELGAGN